MTADKQLMAKNIKRFMEEKGVNAAEVCKVLGIKHNTFSDWINAKAYPRIDKIEKMANYFGVTKADLVEDKQVIIDRANMLVTAYSNSEAARKLFALPDEEREFIIKQIEFIYNQTH